MSEQVGDSQDAYWMEYALDLARYGIGTTSPNPPVGAVIVKHGRMLGEGYHRKAGELHAERRAIANAIERQNEGELSGATIYVTLEPCSSHGRTPPCVDAIIEHGIKRVVYGSKDPDPRHRGRADWILRNRGIEVLAGVEKEACDRLIRPWAHSVLTQRPWVVAKVASTLDGHMTRSGSRWLSCPEGLRYAHQLRLESDAILVGGGTVRCDNPALTIRMPIHPIPEYKQQPWRIVLTHDKQKLPADSTLFTDEYAARTLVYEDVEDLEYMLHELYCKYGIVQLMLECGGKLLRKFLEQGLVNEMVHSLCPVIGGGGDDMVPGDFLPQELLFQRESIEPAGMDIILRGVLMPLR